MEPPRGWGTSGQPGSSRSHPGCPCLTAGLHSADRSASTPLLVAVVECWSGHRAVYNRDTYLRIVISVIFSALSVLHEAIYVVLEIGRNASM